MKSKKNQLKKQKKQPKSTQTNLLICDPGHEIEITLQLANKKLYDPFLIDPILKVEIEKKN
jgi:hypothetical protein